jgi:general secretion pathway protein A
MYDRFYGFSEEPFRLSPDHHFAYQHRGYKKARAYMAYAFMRAEGFVMVTGRPGTGKTTLVGALMDDLANEHAQIATLVCSQLQADDLLSMVAHEFGVDIGITNKGQQLQHLTRQLQKWHREGRRALLIVDEAQDLSVSAMEELRLLTNIQVQGKPLMQIFLLGQPELRELILRPQMEQVHQRIVAASHLKPLEEDETEQYIRHRLSAVGWRGDPAISRAVYPLIFKFSEGIARRINLICSRLLLHGSVEGLHRIGAQDVRTVVEELQGESLAAGSVFTPHDFDVEDVYERELEAVPAPNAPSSDGEGDDEPPSGGADKNVLWRRRMRRQGT